MSQKAPAPRSVDAVIVGAGFAGLYLIHKLRGLGLKVVCFEAGTGVGGTWYWNRYPGARCDVESVEYSYSFSEELQQEWTWTERYPEQAEILRYINHVADRFDLRRDIRFNTRVNSVRYDEKAARWTVTAANGETATAAWCISAVGCLSLPRTPSFKGLETFKGEWYHTGDWPRHNLAFIGNRVGVIGTGSSGIQAIPVIADKAAHVHVFQRTANFSLPARNRILRKEELDGVKSEYPSIRKRARLSGNGYALLDGIATKSALEASDAERKAEYERRWSLGGAGLPRAYTDFATSKAANDTAADFVRGKIRSIVKDSKTAEMLCPSGYAIGTKRLPIDTDYFETYNRSNVTLVDVRNSPTEEITPTGLRTKDASYALDVIVFATGYDAMTGSLLAMNVVGKGGIELAKEWEAGPRTYLGLGIAGFPNFFTVTGPGSPSVLSNVITSIEQHVEWIADCIDRMRKADLTKIEAKREAQDSWVAHVNEAGNKTLYPSTNSWYMGANIPGKPRVFMPYIGGVGNYRIKCDEVAAKNYEGFVRA